MDFMPILIVFLVLVVLVVGWYISTSNNFKRMRIKVEESQSGIEIALGKRYDVLTKLLDATKGFMTHEKEVLTKVIELRRGMSVSEMNTAAQQMSQMAKAINVTAEAYPELRSSQVFVELQNGIKDTEEHLQAARRLYNSNVTKFNTAREVFPSSIVGSKYAKFDFFEVEDYKRNDVQMKF